MSKPSGRLRRPPGQKCGQSDNVTKRVGASHVHVVTLAMPASSVTTPSPSQPLRSRHASNAVAAAGNDAPSTRPDPPSGGTTRSDSPTTMVTGMGSPPQAPPVSSGPAEPTTASGRSDAHAQRFAIIDPLLWPAATTVSTHTRARRESVTASRKPTSSTSPTTGVPQHDPAFHPVCPGTPEPCGNAATKPWRRASARKVVTSSANSAADAP